MYKSQLKIQYFETVVPQLKSQLKCDNCHAIPRLEKIVVSMGFGAAAGDRKRIDEACGHIAVITGQKPIVTKAKKAVSGFRLRQGMDVGCCVTLRGTRMYDFLSRVCNFALPRVRDFRGLKPDAFDGNGNYSFGINEQLVFPEIDPDSVNQPQGMNIAIVTSAKNDQDARLLLNLLGVPFQKA